MGIGGTEGPDAWHESKDFLVENLRRRVLAVLGQGIVSDSGVPAGEH